MDQTKTVTYTVTGPLTDEQFAQIGNVIFWAVPYVDDDVTDERVFITIHDSDVAVLADKQCAQSNRTYWTESQS
jgi:hypothetical protein